MKTNGTEINDDVLKGLPSEVRQQLKGVKYRKLEQEVCAILTKAAQPLTANDILIALYTDFGLTIKRPNLKAQLWHLARAGIISHKPYKGLYNLKPKEGNGHAQ